MKAVAFVFGLCISTVGALGILAPSGLVWIAQHFVTSGAFYCVAAVRVAFGLVLISVASASRAPKALRVLGYVIVIAGVATALTGLLGIGRARTIIEWWLRQGSGLARVTGVLVLALGGFVTYACAPARRAASSMRPWSRATVQEYLRLTLRAHSLLHDVPVHDIWRVALPDGGPSRTMTDVRSVFQAAIQSQRLSLPVRALFGLRWWIGRLFRWDRPVAEREEWSFRARLSDTDRRQSTVEPGTLDGPFTVLYVHAREAVGEIRNATVHGFLVWALEPTPDGYQLFWAIHVLPVSAWTKPYLRLIDPFRRWLVYPALLRRIHESWTHEFKPSRLTSG